MEELARSLSRLIVTLSVAVCALASVPTAAAALTASAWGDNTYGELGIGTSGSGTAAKVPVSIAGLGEDAKAISAGEHHALALMQAGTVMAWGNNGTGELGDGTNDLRDAPVSVNGLSGVEAVAAGGGHSLALMSDGTVMAWGRNDVGQLGIGTTSGPETCQSELACSRTPVQVADLSGVKAIATSYDHSLALLNDGTVVAWGRNQWGELGTGATGPESCGDGWLCNPTPTTVAGLGGVTEVATGHSQSLALLGDGTVMAWGYNEAGNLGVGMESGPQSCGEEGVVVSCTTTPLAVQGLSGVAAIASGWLHNLALLQDGTVMAWGYNSNGQLGDGTNVDRDHPVTVAGLSGVTAVAAGSYHSMALLNDGTVQSWGWNVLWSLGNAAAGDESRAPIPVDGLTGATAITTGSMNGYALGNPPATFPKVSHINPHSGPEEGGTVVTITGTELGSVTSVKFGSTDATSFTVDSDTSVTAISPPGAGVVAVTVADARGSSYASGGTYFRYGAEEPSCVIEPWECKGVGPPEEPPAGPPVEPPEPPVKPPAPPVKPFIEGPESPGVTAPSVVRTGASTPSTAHRCKHRWIQKAKRPQKKRRKAFLCASIR